MPDDDDNVITVEPIPTLGSISTSQPSSSYGGDESIDSAYSGLLPTYKRHLTSHESSDNTVPPDRRWPTWMVLQQPIELISFLFVLATAVPVMLLLIYAPSLSEQLGSQPCLPNGDFLLPGTASIWDPAYFFTINIIVTGGSGGCTYTLAKIIDIVWDVVVGRGGQLILICIAYRVFNRSLIYVMEKRAVSYQTYSAVSFGSTSLTSISQYLQNIHWPRSGSSWHSWRIFLAMTLASLYVVSMPTLLSAMTGYAAVFAASIEIPPAGTEGGYNCAQSDNCSIFLCNGEDGFAPGWGTVIDSPRTTDFSLGTITWADAYSTYSYASDVRKYYEQYEAEYHALATDPACRDVTNFTDCPATNIESLFSTADFNLHLEAPLLNIQLWGNNSETGVPDVWLCNGLIINTFDLNAFNVTGICNAGPSYQWGFSFLLLLIVCILNLLFAIIVYCLWMEARRNSCTPRQREKKIYPGNGEVYWKAVDYPSTINSVMLIANQARSDYGDEVFEWHSKKLSKEVWGGKKGLRARKPVCRRDSAGDQ